MPQDEGRLCTSLPWGNSGQNTPREAEDLSTVVEKNSGWSSWQSSWEAGELGAWVRHWWSPGRQPPLLGGQEVAEAAQQDPSFSMSSTMQACPWVLCSLKPIFWWLFLSLCCSFKKRRVEELGLTAEGWLVTSYLPTGKHVLPGSIRAGPGTDLPPRMHASSVRNSLSSAWSLEKSLNTQWLIHRNDCTRTRHSHREQSCVLFASPPSCPELWDTHSGITESLGGCVDSQDL